MHEKGGPFAKILGVMGRCLPGERFKTSVYLNCIAAPRKAVREAVNGFYRMDHIYEVLREFGVHYEGRFSILEFGVADGYSFTKKLFATEYLGMADRVVLHGFDTFEGLPDLEHSADEALVAGEEWTPGTYLGRYEDLKQYCASRYRNWQLHRGTLQGNVVRGILE